MPGTPSRAKRRVKRAGIAPPALTIEERLIDDLREQLHQADTDLRNTRSLLQAARAEVATVRKAMAEMQTHYAKPWWQRFFDWLVT